MATRVVPIPYRLCPYEPAANLGTTTASLGLGVNSPVPCGQGHGRSAQVLVPGATIGPVTGRTGLLESGT